MADLSNVTFQPQNPDALFSPDQWLNQYSLFSNKALPWPSSYAGAPTDAMGNPIQSYTDANNAAQSNYQAQLAQYNAGQGQQQAPGTTLNSTPTSYPQGIYTPGAVDKLGVRNPSGDIPLSSFAGGDYGSQASNDASGLMMLLGMDPTMGMPKQSAPAGPAPPAPPNMWQATLSALANPGKVTTPGANVPASPTSSQPSSGALRAFMQNFKPAQSGPGSQFQQGFGNTLKGLGY
jgi:hypothetical protein